MSEASSRKLPWIFAALLVSLAINCMLGGILAGRGTQLFVRPQPPAVQNVNPEGFTNKINALPDADKHKFNAAMKPYRPAIKDARMELAMSRLHLAEIMTHEPYDPAAAIAALDEVRHKTLALQQLVQDHSAEALAEISNEARRQLVTPQAKHPE